MIPRKHIPIHPGEVLIEEFLRPMNISQTEFSQKLAIPIRRVGDIIKGKRGISSDTAWKFAEAFGTTPQFWMNLQTQHDLARTRPAKTARAPIFRSKPRHAA